MELRETEQTARVARGLDAVRRDGGMMLFWGPHGVGKSAAVELAAETRPEVRTVVLMPAGAAPSPRAFFAEIALGLEIEVRHETSAAQVVAALVTEVRSRDLTVVLDDCEQLRPAQLPYLRHLVDRLPRLAIVGTEALRSRLQADEALAWRCRLPLGVRPLSLEQVGDLWGGQYSPEALREAWTACGGLWGPLHNLLEAQTRNCERAGRPTREVTAADARQTAGAVLLTKAA